MIKSEIEALTGLRFFAALLVLLHHLSADYIVPLFPNVSEFTQFFLFSSAMGVDLFFILSGFVLAYNYSNYFSEFTLGKYGSFLFKRLARIYPLYLACLLLLIVLALYQSAFHGELSKRFDYDDLLKTLLMLQAWSVPPSFTWNTVAWSVSAEWLAYLLFPFILRFFLYVKAKKIILLLLIIFYGALLIGIGHFVTVYGNNVIYLPGLRDVGLLRILVEFPMGVLLFKLYELQKKEPNIKPVAGWLVLIILVSLIIPLSIIWAVPLFLWLVYAIALNRIALCGYLAKPWVVYGGRISYSLYLTHGALLMFYGVLWPVASVMESSFGIRLLYCVSYFSSSLVASILLYHFVEQPCHRVLLKKLNRFIFAPANAAK